MLEQGEHHPYLSGSVGKEWGNTEGTQENTTPKREALFAVTRYVTAQKFRRDFRPNSLTHPGYGDGRAYVEGVGLLQEGVACLREGGASEVGLSLAQGR